MNVLKLKKVVCVMGMVLSGPVMAYGVPPVSPGGDLVLDIEEERRLVAIEFNTEGVFTNSRGLEVNRVALEGLNEILPPIPENRTEPLALTFCSNTDEIQWGDCPTYELGGRGPAGGWVFYVSDSGMRGIEAAPVDLPKSEWGCYNIKIEGAESNAVGDGQKNTKAILDAGCVGKYTDSTEIAARLVNSYELNGFNDWYLPSEDELGLMYFKLKEKGLGNFVTYGSYRSSTDGGSNIYSRERAFSSGQTFGLGRNSRAHVRAVRSF
ncbi:hypothetical protein BMR02_11515 [Methylococcaceae bacterium HT1]|nr:hypothetical protein BMR02_11515 [Methylococcaceae bacterium HT1]TXL13119.1 hypothetical protein BMR04_14630 [Methylococcaceae bacterium HT3]TXL19765.1 hypothetical protein BMR03_14945 [Methylococcaceae bacterium HT2]